jgi:hypothetical protein
MVRVKTRSGGRGNGVSDTGYPLSGFDVPDPEQAPAPAAVARPWSVALAFAFALAHAFLLLGGALYYLGLVWVFSSFDGPHSDDTDVWMGIALGSADAVLAIGFAVAARLILRSGRLLLFLCSIPSTALSVVFLSVSVYADLPQLFDFAIGYLVIPVVAIILALHPRSSAFYRGRSRRSRRLAA